VRLYRTANLVCSRSGKRRVESLVQIPEFWAVRRPPGSNQWPPSLPWTYAVRRITSRRAGATDGDPRQTQRGCAGDSAPLAGSTKRATSVTKLCDRSHCHDGFVLENLCGTLQSDEKYVSFFGQIDLTFEALVSGA